MEQARSDLRKTSSLIELPFSENLIANEKKVLSTFFGKDIAVSEPPEEFFQTSEILSKLSITGFEPHFLPQISLMEADNFPGWKVKPPSWFWKGIKSGKISKDAATFQEGWYLVDGREKPNSDNGLQKYTSDTYIEHIMEYLRRGRKSEILSPQLSESKYVQSVPDGSRFGATPLEIEGTVNPYFGSKIDPQIYITNKRYIEFNFWGNLFYPQWGQTDTVEMFADRFGHDRRLFGGQYGAGGLADVHDRWSEAREPFIAFNPVIRFPQKPR